MIIHCDQDGCETNLYTEPEWFDNAAEGRREMRSHGWKVNVPNFEEIARLDYCPRHRKDTPR